MAAATAKANRATKDCKTIDEFKVCSLSKYVHRLRVDVPFPLYPEFVLLKWKIFSYLNVLINEYLLYFVMTMMLTFILVDVGLC